MNLSKITTLLVTVVVLFSCQPDKSPSVYDFALKIENKGGKNMVEGISYDERTKSINETYESYEIYDASFKFTLAEGEVNDVRWGVEARLNKSLKDGYHFLSIRTFMPIKEYPDVIVYKITSPHVFGDKTEHTLTAYFEGEDAGRRCTRIKFKGKEYATHLNTNDFPYHTALITID